MLKRLNVGRAALPKNWLFGIAYFFTQVNRDSDRENWSGTEIFALEFLAPLPEAVKTKISIVALKGPPSNGAGNCAAADGARKFGVSGWMPTNSQVPRGAPSTNVPISARTNSLTPLDGHLVRMYSPCKRSGNARDFRIA